MASSLSVFVRMTDGRDAGLVFDMEREQAFDLIVRGKAVLAEAAVCAPVAEMAEISQKSYSAAAAAPAPGNHGEAALPLRLQTSQDGAGKPPAGRFKRQTGR